MELTQLLFLAPLLLLAGVLVLVQRRSVALKVRLVRAEDEVGKLERLAEELRGALEQSAGEAAEAEEVKRSNLTLTRQLKGYRQQAGELMADIDHLEEEVFRLRSKHGTAEHISADQVANWHNKIMEYDVMVKEIKAQLELERELRRKMIMELRGESKEPADAGDQADLVLRAMPSEEPASTSSDTPTSS